MFNKGKIISINISTQKGTIKQPVDEAIVNEYGIVNDAHAGATHRQISLMSKKSIDQFNAEFGTSIKAGDFAENITLFGIDLKKVKLSDRFIIGEVELEVSQIGKQCHGSGCAIYETIGKCAMPKEGIFCKVIKGGKIKVNDLIEHNF